MLGPLVTLKKGICRSSGICSPGLASDARGKGKCDVCGGAVGMSDVIAFCVIKSEHHEDLDCNYYLCGECGVQEEASGGEGAEGSLT